MTFDETIIGAQAFLEKYQKVIIHSATLFFLVGGFCYSLYLGNDLRFPDERKYYSLAVNLVKGNGYTIDGENPTAILTPGYPLFLSIFVKFGASPIFLRYLNFIALALCLYVIKKILDRESTKSGLALSSLLLAGYGVLFYTAGTLYPQTIFTLLLLLIFWLVTGKKFTYLHATIFGFLSALMIMLHSTALFIPPLIVLWLFAPKNWHIMKKAFVSALIVVACTSLWAYRNYKVFDAFIPLSTHGWDTFYAGNNPNADVMAWHKSMTPQILDQAKLLNEVKRERFYREKVLKFWRENPGTGIKLYILKLLNYFNFQNRFYMRSEFNSLKSIIIFVTYYPLLICFIARLFFIPQVQLNRVEGLLILLYITSALFHAIFITRLRFRLPYDALLIVHVGLMFSLTVNWMKIRRAKKAMR